MRIFLLLLCSIFSGIFAGMGMGGGTFLVPFLSLIFGIEQIFCQSTNVICFLFLAIVCAIIYARKKMIDYKIMFCVGLPAMLVAGVTCFFSIRIDSFVAKVFFAGFIILLGVINFVIFFIRRAKNKVD